MHTSLTHVHTKYFRYLGIEFSGLEQALSSIPSMGGGGNQYLLKERIYFRDEKGVEQVELPLLLLNV